MNWRDTGSRGRHLTLSVVGVESRQDSYLSHLRPFETLGAVNAPSESDTSDSRVGYRTGPRR